MTEKEKLLKLFHTFAKFCDDNHLSYFAAYGTALGAIRHNGFIPWDDDIDVHMLRKDYDRMLQLRNELPASYRIADISDIGYTAPFAKFIDNNSSIWEFEHVPYMLGAYIDIFPIDDCPKNNESLSIKAAFDKSFNNYYISLQKWTYKYVVLRLLKGRPIAFWNSLKVKIYMSRRQKKYHTKLMTLYKKLISLHDDNDCISTCSVLPGKHFMKKEWFRETIEIKFEDTTIKVPKAYDQYLSFLYNNYMQEPPIDKRVTHHSRFFSDLERGLTIEEAKKIIKENKK